MKKKKLKKRIKRLEQQVVDIANAQNGIIHNLRDRISTLDDTITKNDQSYKSEFGTIKHSAREIRNKVDILERRTTTDYTQFSEKSCETCKYNDLPSDVGPCMGCTPKDKIMYSPKEN